MDRFIRLNVKWIDPSMRRCQRTHSWKRSRPVALRRDWVDTVRWNTLPLGLSRLAFSRGCDHERVRSPGVARVRQLVSSPGWPAMRTIASYEPLRHVWQNPCWRLTQSEKHVSSSWGLFFIDENKTKQQRVHFNKVMGRDSSFAKSNIFLVFDYFCQPTYTLHFVTLFWMIDSPFGFIDQRWCLRKTWPDAFKKPCLIRT